ncbi:transposase family protein [Streptomyces mirabilis]|uniref:integrase catalytic domain-containing protein n=1 Tax=Streptomyces mirabilis TaxID=68239 RepID=UPI00332CBDBB
MVATGPSQVFTWDIIKAAGPVKGIWYHAYVIIDIFSRYIVGHTVERAESALRAEGLIRETIARNGIVPQTVHADRGTSMTSKKVSQLLIVSHCETTKFTVLGRAFTVSSWRLRSTVSLVESSPVSSSRSSS